MSKSRLPMDIGFETLKQSSAVTLPMELIFSCILPKLPAKSLLRFKCISKSFLTEILSHKFNASFSEANCFLILPAKPNTFGIYELNSPQSPPTMCPYPMPSKWNWRPFVACCESYLLIRCTNGYSRPETLILLNPITRIYRILPTVHIPNFSDDVYGMCPCLDGEFNNDVKIVRFVEYGGPHGYGRREVNIYQLSTNLWRIMEPETTDQWMDDPVLVQNHLLVMIFYDYSDDDYRLKRIGCFDIKAERWSNDVLLPDTISAEISSNSTLDGHYFDLGVLDGKLCFLWYDKNKATYSVCVMKDYGVKSSWFKLMSLTAQAMKEVYHPIAYRKGSSHELLCISKYTAGKCNWYSLREKHFTETEFDINVLRIYNSFAYIFKGSLSNLPGGQPIRSSSKEQDVDNDNNTDDGHNTIML